MKVAIMIPMDEESARAHRVGNLRPDGWPRVEVWPEWPEQLAAGSTRFHRIHGAPRLPGDIAADTRRWIEEAIAEGREHMVIVTRSAMVVHRARRMMLEGAPIEVSIHFPGSAHPPATVLPSGELDSWPAEVFGETASEVGAILRGMKRRGESEKDR